MSDHTPHDDAAGDLVTGGTRALLMAATVVAEQTARYYRDLKARRAAEESHTADHLGAEYNAARHLAWATVQATDQRWIDQTDPAQVANVWETAQAWARTEPETFTSAADRIADLIEDHYGINVREMATDQSIVDQLQQPTRGDQSSDQSVDQAVDEAAATTVSAATGVEAAAPSDAERRERLSERLTDHDVDQDVHASRIRSSHAQAEPAKHAVQAQARKDARAHRSESPRSRGKDQSRD